MTNLTVRPDAGPSRCSQPAPRTTTAKTPPRPAAPAPAAPEMARSAGTDGQAEPSPDAATATTATPARAIARARRGQAGRRPADPVNEIVTSGTAAPQGPLRRRRRWISAPWTTWHSGWRTRTTRPTPAPRSGQERTPPRTGARWASPRTSGASGQYRHDHPEIQRVASFSWLTPFSHVRDEPGLIGPASRRTGIPARACHHQSR
jgi:hypothetical protein